MPCANGEVATKVRVYTENKDEAHQKEAKKTATTTPSTSTTQCSTI